MCAFYTLNTCFLSVYANVCWGNDRMHQAVRPLSYPAFGVYTRLYSGICDVHSSLFRCVYMLVKLYTCLDLGICVNLLGVCSQLMRPHASGSGPRPCFLEGIRALFIQSVHTFWVSMHMCAYTLTRVHIH